jgi:hypothetical protein
MDELKILSSTRLLDQTTLPTRHQPQDRVLNQKGGELPAVGTAAAPHYETARSRQEALLAAAPCTWGMRYHQQPQAAEGISGPACARTPA